MQKTASKEPQVRAFSGNTQFKCRTRA